MSDLSTSTNYVDWQNALYAVLYAEDKNRGGVYVYDWLRWGGLTQHDIITIRDGYYAYKSQRENRPAVPVNSEDTGATVHGEVDLVQGKPGTYR